MVRINQLLTFLVIGLLLTGTSLARGKEKIKRLTPTGKGSTGLFNLYVADTLRQGEVSIGLNSIHFNREPGDLDFTLFPVSITVGLHDRVESFIFWEAHRRVNADAIKVNKVAPGGAIVPARLRNPVGTVAYFNDAPFMDVGFGSAPGELWTGVKFNLLSERRGDPFGVALQPIIKFPLSEDRTRLLRGLTNGAIEAGYDIILSKDLGGGTLTGNYGHLFAEDSKGIDLQNRLNYGLGYEKPIGTGKVQVILELVGSLFFGERTGIANPKSPLDFYSGLRFSPSRWISISAAYNANFRYIDQKLPIYGIQSTDRSGWFAQVVFHRKTNQPPTVECVPTSAVVRQGDSVTIRALIADPDDDLLSMTWRASAGAISQRDSLVVFDSTGVKPGRYSVRAEISDGEHIATCSTYITVVTVEKRKMPPGASSVSVIR